MLEERRDHDRRPFFLTGELKWPGHTGEATTTNVSRGGAFLGVTGPLPLRGTRILFTVEPSHDRLPIELRAVVVRVVPREASGAPGVAVRWLGAESHAEADYFARFMERLFDDSVIVIERENGPSFWASDADVAPRRVESDSTEFTVSPEAGRPNVRFASR